MFADLGDWRRFLPIWGGCVTTPASADAYAHIGNARATVARRSGESDQIAPGMLLLMHAARCDDDNTGDIGAPLAPRESPEPA